MIYEMYLESNRHTSLIPHDLDYFGSHFVGRRMGPAWEPPPVTLDGKSKPLGDFTSWMTTAPVLSPRAAELVSSIAGDRVEMLPFHEIRGRASFAMNVLNVVEGVDAASVRDAELIFKHRRVAGRIYCASELASAIREAGLTGLSFADPRADNFSKMLRGEQIDAFRG